MKNIFAICIACISAISFPFGAIYLAVCIGFKGGMDYTAQLLNELINEQKK